jgi:hypothetical protein
LQIYATPANIASNFWIRRALLILLDLSDRITIVFEHKYLKLMEDLADLLFLLLDLLCFWFSSTIVKSDLLRGGGGLH